MTISAYYRVHYKGAIVPNSFPDHLSLCTIWHNGRHSPLQRFHLTELGCGDGANLLPIAFYHPDSAFTGIDNAGSELSRAREGVRQIGLQNVQFVQKDICEIEAADFDPCDYIIAHGLFSWVSDDTRDAILSFCAHNLKLDGLAYISYNAQPGWSTRKLLREKLLHSQSVRDAPLAEKGQMAIEVARQLLADLPSRDYASAVLLADELERVINAKPWYIFHEYLTEVNDGFWLTDFVKKTRSHGLEYVTDAQSCRPEGQIPAKLKESLANRNLDPLEQEERADLLCNRYFRASILCRSDAPRKKTSRRKLMEEVYIAVSLQTESDPFDLTDGVTERFSSSAGHEIKLDRAITKAAILVLSTQWPRGIQLADLYQQAMKLLAAHGCEVPANARSLLTDEVATLFEAGQVDLRLEEPVYDTHIPEYPKIHALARFEIEHREALTTPFHLPLLLDPEALAVLRSMDGSRSRSELRGEFGDDLVEQTLNVVARWGLLN